MRTLKNRLVPWTFLSQTPKVQGCFCTSAKKSLEPWAFLFLIFIRAHWSELKPMDTQNLTSPIVEAISAQTRSLTQVDWKKSANQTHTIHRSLTDIVDQKNGKIVKNHVLVFPLRSDGRDGVFGGKQLLQQQNSATDFSNSSQTTSNKDVPPVIESCATLSSGYLNMKVYCTNTCHDISQYLAMERLHPGKPKQFKFSAGLTDVTTRPSKMKVSPKIIKSWSLFW